MHKDVPFIANTSDDLHCVQAAFLMILKYFKPDMNMTMSRWSRLTGYEEGMGTWASKGLMWFDSHGFEVQHYEQFDYDAFIKDGGDYLIRLAGPEAGQWQVEHSNIPLEQRRAKQLLTRNLLQHREPTIEDTKRFLNEGYLLRVLINARKLNNKAGYVGHAVVVTGYDDKHIIFHDPGLPPMPNRKATFAEFEAAWADPNIEAKELDAIRPKA